MALGCGAVATQADGNPRFLSQFERAGYACGMRRLRSDRNAVRKIMRRSGRAIAALIPSPKQEDFLHPHAAPEQRAIVSVGRNNDVLLAHGAGDADRDRLLAERNSVGTQPSRALERDCLEIKCARQHHAAVERQEQMRIGGEYRQLPKHGPVCRQICAAAHLKPRNHRKLLVYGRFLGHARTPMALNPANWTYRYGRADDSVWRSLPRAFFTSSLGSL